MAMKAATLPRHTNLASQGLRYVAVIVDFAIWLALFLGLYFGCFCFVVSSKTSYYGEILETYRLDSHIAVKGEDGKIGFSPSTDWHDHQNNVEAFYFRYLGQNPSEGEVSAPKQEYYEMFDEKVAPESITREFYNTHVLRITQEDPEGAISESLFTLPKDGEGNYIRDGIATFRAQRYDSTVKQLIDITEDDKLAFFKARTTEAFLILSAQTFYTDNSNALFFFTTLAVTCSLIVGSLIVYVLMPLIFKKGQTIGKKVFKIGLCNYEGYSLADYQIFLRYVPLFLLLSAQLIPNVFSSILMIVIIYTLVFMISFTFAVASPKKCALHDFAARTIVVDLSTSIIFDNQILEEEYLAKEDGFVSEEVESDGEEPRLRYER